MSLSVDFDATNSSGEDDKPIASYTWEFGDGTTGSGVAPTHLYPSEANYNVTLTVTNSCGGTDTVTDCIHPTEEVTSVGNIQGTVLDTNNNPIPSAKATITDTLQYALTDATGTFTITSVPIGTHTISITKEGYATKQVPVSITEGFNELPSSIILQEKAISKTTIIIAAAIAGASAVAIGAFILRR